MGLFKKKDGNGKEYGLWWYDFRFAGLRYRESTKSKDKKTAERIERERRRRLEEGRGGIKPIAQAVTFAVASAEWLEVNKAHWSTNQHRIEGYNLKHLTPHFGKLVLTDITGDDVSRYQSKRKGQDASNKTINLEVATLRAILRRHRLWANIQPDVRMLKTSEEVGRALTDDEQHRLLVACKSSRSRALYPAFLVSLRTGLRSGELLSLRWWNVDLVSGEVTVGKSKTQAGEGRSVPLSDDAWACLKKWRSQFRDVKPEHYVFPAEKYGLDGETGRQKGKIVPYSVDPTSHIQSFKVAWTSARKKAKVKCRWHDARHTFISKMGEKPNSDRTIMALAGHVSKKMLERYSHIGNTAKRQAIATAFNTTEKTPRRANRQKWAQYSHPKGNQAAQPIM